MSIPKHDGASSSTSDGTVPTKSNNVSEKKQRSRAVSSSSCSRPWYASGGMHVNLIGLPLNSAIAVIFLAAFLESAQWKAFGAIILVSVACSLFTSRTVYCILATPILMVSMLLCLSLQHPALCMALSFALAIIKVNICMSVCLHRYAAHAAFKCGPMTHICMLILGCLANQGGPIWWASQHRCHHKYCDVPRDPHSPVLVGIERAYCFFEDHPDVEEEFAPRHLESAFTRVLDTWAWLLVSAELALSYLLFGQEGLFVAFTSSWLCQAITLWFNIVNHPPDLPAKCKATDTKTRPSSWYLPFHFLYAIMPIFGIFVMEGEHERHHDNASLAKRAPYDSAYWSFIKPLQVLGLVWNVNVE